MGVGPEWESEYPVGRWVQLMDGWTGDLLIRWQTIFTPYPPEMVVIDVVLPAWLDG